MQIRLEKIKKLIRYPIRVCGVHDLIKNVFRDMVIKLSPTPNDDYSSREKIEALAEIICRGGDESAAALFVLMATLANSTQPKAIENTAKHFAFTRCGELNLYGLVDAQIAVLEAELLEGQ